MSPAVGELPALGGFAPLRHWEAEERCDVASVGRLCHNSAVRLGELLKLLGAGVTGGVIAARLHHGRKRRREFLLVRQAVANELRHQFHTVVLQALLPGILPERSAEWAEALRTGPSFEDELAALRRLVSDFNRRVGEALERLVRLASEGNLAPVTRRRMAPDLDLYNRAVMEILQQVGMLAAQSLGVSEDELRGKGGMELLHEVSHVLRGAERFPPDSAEPAAKLLRTLDSFFERLERS